jgi:hypothetical protein
MTFSVSTATMAVVDSPDPASVPDPIDRTGRPLRLHVFALGAILAALLPVAGTGAVWSADEGALLYQASALADGRGWEFNHPLPAADPAGTAFPIHLSSWAVDGSPNAGADCVDRANGCRYVVLAKHTTYLHTVAWLYGLGGYRLILLSSVLGTLLAAAAAARLTRMIEPTADRSALWLTGLASPLLIDGYVAWAHTPAAAAIGWGMALLLIGTGADGAVGRVRSLLAMAAGAALLAVACLLRTEATIAGLAVGVGFALAARLAGRPPAAPVLVRTATPTVAAMLLAAAAAGVGTVIGTVVDRVTAYRTGGPVEPVGYDEAFGGLVGRFDAFALTWLRPGYGGDPIDLFIMGGAAALLAGAVVARRGPSTAPMVTAALSVAVGLLAARFVVAPSALIPGLVMACPVLLAGLLLAGRRSLGQPSSAAVTAAFSVFCLGVLATQYRQGGGGEWGGRYFAVGLPLGMAIAAVGVRRGLDRFDGQARRRLVVAGGTYLLLLSTLGLLGLRDVRGQTENLAARIDDAVTAAVAVEGSNPVVVTTIQGTGRWMWADVDRVPWLRVPSADLDQLGARLAAAGVDPVILVTPEARLNDDDRALRPFVVATLDQRMGSIGAGWAVVTATASQASRPETGPTPSPEVLAEDP